MSSVAFFPFFQRSTNKVDRHPRKTNLGGDGHDMCHEHLEAFRQFKQDYGRLYESSKIIFLFQF